MLRAMSFHRLTKDDTKPAAGREIDAWCTRCKRELGHTITAMVGGAVVQVRCNTCAGVHKFRAPAAEKAKARAKTVRAKSTAKEKAVKVTAQVRKYQQRIADRNLEDATKYSPRLDPSVGDLIDHPNFGLGVVDAVSDDKAAILFADGKKMLVIGR